MDFFLQLCHKPQKDTHNEHIEPNIYIAILFQNIAYTSSLNYAKWFGANYTHDSQKRDRSYSLDTHYDFDSCPTERSLTKISSMETIYETIIDPHFIDDFYSPLYKELIPYFEENIRVFPRQINSITFQLTESNKNCKLKWFSNGADIYITVLMAKEIVPVAEFTQLDKFIISKTYADFWEVVSHHNKINSVINNLMNYNNIYMVSHFKNSPFTDVFCYKLLKTYNLNIKYIAINPHQKFPSNFYHKLDKMCKYMIFNNTRVRYPSSRMYEYYNETNGVFCCRSDSDHYRRNLKKITFSIFSNYPTYI